MSFCCKESFSNLVSQPSFQSQSLNTVLGLTSSNVPANIGICRPMVWSNVILT